MTANCLYLLRRSPCRQCICVSIDAAVSETAHSLLYWFIVLDISYTYIYIHTEQFIERYSREIESEALDDSELY